MKALLIALSLALLVVCADSAGATAGNGADPQQQKALIDQIRAQLGSNLADAMAAQVQLQQSLQNNAHQQQDVQAKIVDVQAKIAALDSQIADAMVRKASVAVDVVLGGWLIVMLLGAFRDAWRRFRTATDIELTLATTPMGTCKPSHRRHLWVRLR